MTLIICKTDNKGGLVFLKEIRDEFKVKKMVL